MVQSMEKFNCDMFQITIEFNEEQFKVKEFISDIKEDEDDKFFVYHFGTKNNEIKEHAHLVLDLDGKDSSAKFTYHTGDNKEEKDSREPYFEDFAQWLGGFFENKEVTADITAIYLFSKKDFKPVLELNHPIPITNEVLQDVTVSGYELKFPKESEIKRMIVSEKTEFILSVLNASTTTDLTKFDIYSEIEKFGKYSQPFVEKEASDGK